MEPKESLRDHIFPIKPKLVVNHAINTLVNLKIGPPNRSLKSVSLWMLKNAFWFAIYLLGSCLTIWLCLLLFNDYSRPDNILTHVTANMARMVTLPNITVCIPFNATLLFPLNSSSKTPYSDSIEDFFNKTIENGKFDTTNYIEEWNNSRKNIANETLFILHKYLAIMYEAEYLRKEMESSFANFSWQAESDQEKALLNILVPRIKQLNITTDELKNVLIEYLKTGSEFSGYDGEVPFCIYRFSITYVPCQQQLFDTITYLDRNQICFKTHDIILQADDLDLKNIVIRINNYSQAISMTGRKIVFNFNEDATPPNFAAAAAESSIIEMIIGDYSEIYIDYESVYHGLPVMLDGKLRCSYPTRRQCEEKCRIGLIKAMCGCTPVTFTMGQNDESTCTFAHYENCLNYFGNEDDECRESCPVSCKQTNYKISPPYVRKADTYYTELYIELNKYDYLIYEEKFKWTFMDLISAIGGALGIWLGIDFIVLIRFIFALVAKVFLKVSSLAKLEVTTIEDNQFNFNKSFIKKVFSALNIKVPPQFTRVSLIMWSLEKAVWALIYLAGGVFTAISCKELYEQYRDSGFKTSMQVSFNKSSSLPPATLCLRHNIYYYNIEFSSEPSTLYTDALSDYLNQKNISKKSILQYGGDGSSWPHVMVYVVYKYLSVLYFYEYDNVANLLPDMDKLPINKWQEYMSKGPRGWADEYCSNYSKDCLLTTLSSNGYGVCSETPHGSCKAETKAALQNDTANAIENVLIPKLTELNITVEELRQKILHQLNSDAQLTFRFFDSNKSTVINNLRAAAFGFWTYCMHIPLENFEFTSEKDYAEIVIENNKTLYEVKRSDSIIFTFDATFDALDSLMSLHDAENREQTKVGSIFEMDIGQSKSFSLRINYKMALEPDSDKCATVKSEEEWVMLHRIKYIEELCNCSPTSWPELLPATSRMCTLEEYKTCLKFNESSWFYNKTLWSNTSGVPCEKAEMDYTENNIIDDETSMVNTSISRIRFRVEDFVYLTIKEELEMTFVDFAVAFGGTLGIVLGLDFRFIAWLIFMPPFVLISYLFRKLLYKKAFFLKPMKNTKLKTALNAKFVRLIADVLELDLSDILKLNKSAFIKNLFKNAYWLIYYTAGGILTFLLFKAVFIDYMRNNNAKVIFEPKTNVSISLPSPTICLPFVSLKIDYDHGQSYIISTNFVQNYLSGKTKTELLEDKWNPAFINYVHSYIVEYGKFEWFSSDDLPKNMDHSAFFDILDNMVNVMDITFEELREKFGRELTKMYQLNITYYASISNETTESLNTSVVFVEESKICYKPLMKSLSFNSSSNFLKITANGTLMHKSDEYFDNWAPITIDLNGRNTNNKGATILDATVLGNFGENTTISLEIETIIKAYPIVGGEIVCSNLLSLPQCRSSCIAQTIQNTCKCLPRTITLTTSSYENAQYCTLADYKQCSLSFRSDTFACFDGCLEPCERIRFSHRSPITTSNLNVESINLVEVNLKIRSFKYQYMEEQLTYTIEEFIGEIGGALGLFLGLSVLMFIEFFYALLNIFVMKKWAQVQPMPELNDDIVETSL